MVWKRTRTVVRDLWLVRMKICAASIICSPNMDTYCPRYRYYREQNCAPAKATCFCYRKAQISPSNFCTKKSIKICLLIRERCHSEKSFQIRDIMPQHLSFFITASTRSLQTGASGTRSVQPAAATKIYLENNDSVRESTTNVSTSWRSSLSVRGAGSLAQIRRDKLSQEPNSCYGR
jgi:hypothetical protein